MSLAAISNELPSPAQKKRRYPTVIAEGDEQWDLMNVA
jgi:hypothetical protein